MLVGRICCRVGSMKGQGARSTSCRDPDPGPALLPPPPAALGPGLPLLGPGPGSGPRGGGCGRGRAGVMPWVCGGGDERERMSVCEEAGWGGRHGGGRAACACVCYYVMLAD